MAKCCAAYVGILFIIIMFLSITYFIFWCILFSRIIYKYYPKSSFLKEFYKILKEIHNKYLVVISVERDSHPPSSCCLFLLTVPHF